MSDAGQRHTCVICDAESDDSTKVSSVRSNVRRFAEERFEVWRCPTCRCIHAEGSVDLDRYYQDYPFQRAIPSRVTSYLHRRLWQRIASTGRVSEGDTVLDYGCGAGLLVADLKARGVPATGYDAYTPQFADTRVLAAQYQVVMAQDVIEHVEEPLAFLDMLGQLCRPGGVIAIGTPDASAVDLDHPEHWKHTLHQPFHRHIFASEALLAAGTDHGWQLLRYYPRPYANTPVPTLNLPYLLRYLRANDDTIDVAFDPPRVRVAMFSPGALWDALFGGLRCPRSDGLAVFRKPL